MCENSRAQNKVDFLYQNYNICVSKIFTQLEETCNHIYLCSSIFAKDKLQNNNMFNYFTSLKEMSPFLK